VELAALALFVPGAAALRQQRHVEFHLVAVPEVVPELRAYSLSLLCSL